MAGPTPPCHSGPTHPPAIRPLQIKNRTELALKIVCFENLMYMYTWYAFMCIYVSINVYSARAKPCQGTQAHRAHRSRRHTGTEAHAHRHSAHTSMLHVCCPLVRDEVNWFLQHVHRQYNKMEINIFMRPGKVVRTFSYDTFLLLYVYYVWISVVPRPTEFGLQIDHILLYI